MLVTAVPVSIVVLKRCFYFCILFFSLYIYFFLKVKKNVVFFFLMFVFVVFLLNLSTTLVIFLFVFLWKIVADTTIELGIII